MLCLPNWKNTVVHEQTKCSSPSEFGKFSLQNLLMFFLINLRLLAEHCNFVEKDRLIREKTVFFDGRQASGVTSK